MLNSFSKGSFPIQKEGKVALCTVLIMFSLSIYYYLYFLPFNQGVVEGTHFFNIAKVIIFIGTLYCVNTPWKEITLSPFIVTFYLINFFILFLFVCGEFFGHNDNKMVLNYFLFSFLFAFLVFDKKAIFVKVALFIIPWVLVFQVCLDVVLNNYFKLCLWEGCLFVGGLGNPSSFAFFSMFSFFILTLKVSSKSSALDLFLLSIPLLLLTYGIIKSSALAIVLLHFLGILGLILFTNSKKRIYYCLMFVAGALILLAGASPYLSNKIGAFLYFLGVIDTKYQSMSISTRAGYYSNQDTSLYKLFNYNYKAYDSQYLTFLKSFGLLGAGLFLIANALFFFKLKMSREPLHMFNIFMFGSFALIFFNNRILDYYPVSILYLVACVLIVKSESCYRENP